MLTAITGGSGSGKTTLARALCRALPGGCATLVSEDWYYRDTAALPGFDAATFDFDGVAARDHALLAVHLRALKAGERVTAPVYSFVTHRRLADAGTPVAPAPVVVVEGSHLLSDPALAGLFDLRVYVQVADDVRFIRRLLRDRAERGRTTESVVGQYLATVRPAHHRFTEPARAAADLVIDDRSAAVDQPDARAVADLIAPILAHPLLRSFLSSCEATGARAQLGSGSAG